MIRSGDEHRASIRDAREVYINGEAPRHRRRPPAGAAPPPRRGVAP